VHVAVAETNGLDVGAVKAWNGDDNSDRLNTFSSNLASVRAK
jgi:hypothetical protein